jgi:predicted metal-dependent hydrolase
MRDGVMHVTVPSGTPEAELRRGIDKLRPRLRKMQEVRQPRLIDQDFTIDAHYFRLHMTQSTGERFKAHSELGELTISYPTGANFADADLQTWLRKVITEALRRNAQIILPPRLYQLSMEHNLPYKAVKINSSTGRWGSCSSKDNINLSLYLMLLPKHLIDYVLLHELAHIRVKNHGEAFHRLLNELTEGKSDALSRGLKEYKTSF